MSEPFRRGIRIGLDVGSVRVGVARTDPDGILAVPVATVKRSSKQVDIAEIVALVTEYEPVEIVVGLPIGLGGAHGPAVQAVTDYARDLSNALAGNGIKVPIRLIDERMSTMQATRQLQSAGRDAREGRSVIDQAAAVIIVQQAVDQERATGIPPGELLAANDAGPTDWIRD
ncbi:MAG: Holliday junction resolvase RuvX [Actinomycetes bacterium]